MSEKSGGGHEQKEPSTNKGDRQTPNPQDTQRNLGKTAVDGANKK